MISSLLPDESLDAIQPKQLKLDDSIHLDPIKVTAVHESVCICDGIVVITYKKIPEAVCNMLNNIPKIGRHVDMHCIVANQLPTNGKDTRRILNEAHTVAYFPLHAGGKIKHLLE